MSCKFTVAWVGPCGEATPSPSEFCEKHLGKTCSSPSCGKQATQECEEAGSMVCGAYLCDSHEHVGLWGHG